MKLILKENPDVELTVTVEYPERNIQVSRIIQKLKAQEQFLIGSENGRNYRVLMSDIFYIEKVWDHHSAVIWNDGMRSCYQY